MLFLLISCVQVAQEASKSGAEARAANDQAKLAGKEAAEMKARCAQLEAKCAAQLQELATVWTRSCLC